MLRVLAALVLLAGCTAPTTTFSAANVEVLSCGDHCAFELDLHLSEPQDLEWTWSASQAMRFTIHEHRGSQVTNWVVRNGVSDHGVFRALSPGDYSLSWSHTNQDLAYLDYKVVALGKADEIHR